MRRTKARRILTVAATIVATTAAAGACARMGAGSASGGGGGGESSYRADVALRPDSTLRIARTQLEHHNYKVSDAGPNAIVTLPAPIPAYLQDKSGATKSLTTPRAGANRSALLKSGSLRIWPTSLNL